MNPSGDDKRVVLNGIEGILVHFERGCVFGNIRKEMGTPSIYKDEIRIPYQTTGRPVDVVNIYQLKWCFYQYVK